MRLPLLPWLTQLRILLFLLILTEYTLIQAFKLPGVTQYDESFLDDTKNFPHAVDVTIFHNDKQILLELEKNPYLDLGVPAIALRGGGDGERVYTQLDKDFQPYQDPENGAAITFSCTGGGVSCQPTLEGSYFHGGYLYQLEPAGGHTRLKRGAPGGRARHHVYKRDHPHTDPAELHPEPVTIQIRPGRTKRRRVRRQETPTYIVEILLVLDYEIYKRFYESVPVATRSREEVYFKLKQYYFQVLNGMDMRYNYIPTRDFSIRIRLSSFIIAEEKLFSPWTENYVRNGTVDVKEVLSPFAETKEEIQQKYGLAPFDHAMAMTGYDLIFEDKKTTLGYAYLNTTCQYWSVSLIEDRNDIMKTIWTASHEFGHSMGARHDGYQNSCQSHRRYIMTSTIDKPSQLTRENPWQFSMCSINYFREMVEKLNRQPLNCLQDTSPPNFFGTPEWQQHLNARFGTLYNPDEQCQRIHGNNSYMCRHKILDPNLICTNLWCHRIDPDTGESECTPHLAAPGTTCGNKKWCQRGQCVFNQAASPVDDCPYGDQPGVGLPAMGTTCEEKVTQNRNKCDNSDFRLQCCKACRTNTTVSLRKNRGTIGGSVVDNYMIPKRNQVKPAAPSSPSLRVGSGTSLGSVDLSLPSTSAPRRPVVYQAPPVVQQQPDPEPPAVAAPTKPPRPPPGPATGSCKDTGSPFNQSIVGCRGFHTFCYLRRVKRDCCATCRSHQISPAIIYPVDQTRRKRSTLGLSLSRLRRKQAQSNWRLLQAVKRSIGTVHRHSTTALTEAAGDVHPTQAPEIPVRLQTREQPDLTLSTAYAHPQTSQPQGSWGNQNTWSESEGQSQAGPVGEVRQNGPLQGISQNPQVSTQVVDGNTPTQFQIAPGFFTGKTTKISRVVGYVSDIQTLVSPTTSQPQTGSDVTGIVSVDHTDDEFASTYMGLYNDPLHEPPAAI